MKIKFENRNWIEIQNDLNQLRIKEIYRKYHINYRTMYRAYKLGLLVRQKPIPYKHTEITKEKLSKIKQDFFAKNPDKHPWRKHTKFISPPCERVKNLLRTNGVKFIEEFQPHVENRHFSIDIAFPDKLIGLEINGNQHYTHNGNLKEYYAERERILERNGWKIYQIHFSLCYNHNKIYSLIQEILSSPQKINFNYNIILTNTKINNVNIDKRLGPKPLMHKVPHPTKEELGKLVWEKSTIQLSKQFGVSDTAIAKWCKQYHISKPPRGYWAKIKS